MPPFKKKQQIKQNRKEGPRMNEASRKQFKKKESSYEAVQWSEIGGFQLEDDVPDFPRGGGSVLSKKEREEIRREADASFEADESVAKKENMSKKKGRVKRKSESVDELGSLFGDGLTGKLPRFANKITLKNISPGMKLLGVVVELNEKDVVVSLPGGLRGLVRLVDAVDPVMDTDVEHGGINLFTVFHVGQLVSCVVLQLDDDKKGSGKRKIWLSLRLSLLQKGLSLDTVQEGMVLTAYVKSIEDHGYILRFGLPSFMGFLPKNSQAEGKENEVKVGQLLQGVVRSIDKACKVVYLSSEPDQVSKGVMKDLKGLSIDVLVPGMMVNARVQSMLENGIMLSFLTYFTGTVDLFHLPNTFPVSSWKDNYQINKKVNARILFIDPATRAVGLTLNHHLVHYNVPPWHLKVGDIYEDAKVVRVDRGWGVLLECASAPVSIPVYVGVSDVDEADVKKLEKRFKEASHVRVRIIGFRHLEGLATGSLKNSAFEGPMFIHSDVKPGMVVRAKIIAVDSFGAIVLFPGGLKALCPLRHMSEFEIVKPKKKFKVGAELVFRVLGCKSKRITVTHKKTLVKSKLPTLSSYADAIDGLLTHGWITKIEKHGCFVHFYNGVQGFAPRSELGLGPGSDASSMYHVGQVVKCRVMSSIPASHRINLSFIMKPTRVSTEDSVKLGTVVSGTVEKVTQFGVVVTINAKGYARGTISMEHLADHHEHAVLMNSALKPGYEFDQLLVLDIENNNLILSAKYSLINSAEHLPSDLSQIHPESIVPGYVCNIIETGCFVRFLGRLTGFSPRSKAVDNRRMQLSDTFYVGQSVRSYILDVNSDTSRITLSLKQSSCSSTDASFLQGYFLSEEKIAWLQSSDSEGPELAWVEDFKIGSLVEGKVKESKDVGVIVNFDKHNNVYGFIPHHQLGGTNMEAGSTVQAAVLDLARTEHLVDLSLKVEFLDKSGDWNSINKNQKKKRRREPSDDLEMYQIVKGIIEIVKENYVVLSLPEHNHSIGFASTVDYNSHKSHKQFSNGQSVMATVMALPCPATTGRSLLLLNSISEVTETSSSKKARKKSGYDVGSLVPAEVTEIRPLELRLKFGIGFRGRVHITEVNEACIVDNPLSNFRIGETITARVVAKPSEDNKKAQLWELSVKPKVLADSSELVDDSMSEELEFTCGQQVTGYVYKVDAEWTWLTVSRDVNAQLFILDSGYEPSELQDFQKRFYIGRAVSGHVLYINKEKKLVRMVMRPVDVPKVHFNDKEIQTNGPRINVSPNAFCAHIRQGDVLGGRISKILPGIAGLLVQVGPHLHGRVHYTEIQDSWVPDPLSGYEVGKFVKCKVLDIGPSEKGTVHIDLSLRLSLIGMLGQDSREHSPVPDNQSKRSAIEDLHPNTVVHGYVKSVTPKGCFISLSRTLDAKVLLSNLSDGYVDNPEKEFPIGKLVTSRVLSMEPLSKRVEVSLKDSSATDASKSEINDLNQFRIGDIISGRIKRVESYGLFISIDNTNMVGLCHVSQLSEEPINDINAEYKAGEKVTARILKVDKERRRISLGMKNLEPGDKMDFQNVNDDSDEVASENSLSDESDSEMIVLSENEDPVVLDQAELRISIPPLEVTLDDLEQSGDEGVNGSQQINEPSTINEKKKAKKKEVKKKLDKEQEIRAAEERLLERDIPRTADEFEKMVRSSPNSSFIWMKYMEFVLSLADVEKARSIAERALKIISIREEKEKLNIWVAYINLENRYGDPPVEAVKKVFQRALQYCNPKKVHLALLTVYDETEQNELADELLNKMVKKFKQSCKVWLRWIQRLLNLKQDGVQSVIQRALLSLPRHKHIKFIRQTAILEFKCGVPDRGRSMFEGILREYPKRTDLWNVYLDQEIKIGDLDLIRALFERAVSLSLKPEKMRVFFKKYYNFEKSLGDEERMNSIRKRAEEYIKSIAES